MSNQWEEDEECHFGLDQPRFNLCSWTPWHGVATEAREPLTPSVTEYSPFSGVHLQQAFTGTSPQPEADQSVCEGLTFASCSLKLLVLNIWATASNAAVSGSMNCSYWSSSSPVRKITRAVTPIQNVQGCGMCEK